MNHYGLIGNPLGHSFSESYFAAKFSSEQIDATYRNYELPTLAHLHPLLDAAPPLDGFNVTIPYKEAVIPLLDEVDPLAAEIGAVNVVKITRHGETPRLKGYNTDIIGFTQSLLPLLAPHHQRALVLGTGGASKAVHVALQQLGIATTPVSRREQPDGLTYEQLTPEVMAAHTLVVNTTPLGMHPKVDVSPAIPYTLLTSRHLCYDLVYNPTVTKFMQQAEQQGATVKNGLEMLHLQAEAAWHIWTNP